MSGRFKALVEQKKYLINVNFRGKIATTTKNQNIFHNTTFNLMKILRNILINL